MMLKVSTTWPVMAVLLYCYLNLFNPLPSSQSTWDAHNSIRSYPKKIILLRRELLIPISNELPRYDL
jgi:hypothetical protein